MRTERRWPLACRRLPGRALIGVSQRLGSGAPPTADDIARDPPLEALAGPDWSTRVLELLLPTDSAWACWVPSNSPALRQLAPAPMPRQACLAAGAEVSARRQFWRGTTLVVVPPGRTEAQARVLEWAGRDTEAVPEFVWAAAAGQVDWDPGPFIRWCADRSAWRDLSTLAALGGRRVIVLFDGDIYCAAPEADADALLAALHGQASRWGATPVAADESLAWPTPA